VAALGRARVLPRRFRQDGAESDGDESGGLQLPLDLAKQVIGLVHAPRLRFTFAASRLHAWLGPARPARCIAPFHLGEHVRMAPVPVFHRRQGVNVNFRPPCRSQVEGVLCPHCHRSGAPHVTDVSELSEARSKRIFRDWGFLGSTARRHGWAAEVVICSRTHEPVTLAKASAAAAAELPATPRCVL